VLVVSGPGFVSTHTPATEVTRPVATRPSVLPLAISADSAYLVVSSPMLVTAIRLADGSATDLADSGSEPMWVDDRRLLVVRPPFGLYVLRLP
jgi:hypothetical protein